MAKKTEEQIKKIESKPAKTKGSSTSVEKKKTTSTKKVSTKSVKSKSSVKKAPVLSSKTTSTKKNTTSKSTVKKSKVKKSESNIIEYYDLPYKYNKTIVKILAQTPRTLFVYWEISDDDRQNYIKTFGDNFFNESVPVLIVTNVSQNYSFEIQINDFANSWYFNVSDEHCKYTVELGRRPISTNVTLPNNYLYVASSNKIEAPNGHILFDQMQKAIYFKNTKTNETYSKDIANMHFMKYLSKFYKADNIYNLYRTMYKDENIFDINNPTSSFSK